MLLDYAICPMFVILFFFDKQNPESLVMRSWIRGIGCRNEQKAPKMSEVLCGKSRRVNHMCISIRYP
jgi:hypothetical protein